MKRFILNISKFSALVVGAMILLVLVTKEISYRLFDFRVGEHITTLVMGDSFTECAIDDNNLPSVINLSQSGSAYFYSYLKIREIIKSNPQIDTIILGFSQNAIAESREEWFDGQEKIQFKMRTHFFMFKREDYVSILRANPVDVLAFTPQVIVHNLKLPFGGWYHLGGFKKLTRDNLSDALAEYQENLASELTLSRYQLRYLKKIYRFCNDQNVQLVLLSTPVHKISRIERAINTPKLLEIREAFPNAIYLDHSNLDLPDKYFSDRNHLNYHGAKNYSSFLQKTL